MLSTKWTCLRIIKSFKVSWITLIFQPTAPFKDNCLVSGILFCNWLTTIAKLLQIIKNLSALLQLSETKTKNTSWQKPLNKPKINTKKRFIFWTRVWRILLTGAMKRISLNTKRLRKNITTNGSKTSRRRGEQKKHSLQGLVRQPTSADSEATTTRGPAALPFSNATRINLPGRWQMTIWLAADWGGSYGPAWGRPGGLNRVFRLTWLDYHITASQDQLSGDNPCVLKTPWFLRSTVRLGGRTFLIS